MPESEGGSLKDRSSFLSLRDDHKALNELFLVHQEALLAMDIPQAAARLAAYESCLRHHMEEEEQQLLPLYLKAGPRPGGPVEFFTGEHRKMLEFLTRFRDALDRLNSDTDVSGRKIIELFDQQAVYKHLVDHHDQREENILYPALDGATTAQQREELLGRFERLAVGR